jgi:hypothetical protein
MICLTLVAGEPAIDASAIARKIRRFPERAIARMGALGGWRHCRSATGYTRADARETALSFAKTPAARSFAADEDAGSVSSGSRNAVVQMPPRLAGAEFVEARS